jgi:hypothetical protein
MAEIVGRCLPCCQLMKDYGFVQAIVGERHRERRPLVWGTAVVHYKINAPSSFAVFSGLRRLPTFTNQTDSLA